jgi:hypothetical protein
MKRREEVIEGEDDFDHDQKNHDPLQPVAGSILEEIHERDVQIG